jgi:hypothetical protein
MKLYGSFVLLVLFSCGVNEPESENNVVQEELNFGQTEVNTFDQFLSEIPEYKFPVKMSCDYKRLSDGIDFSKYQRYCPNGGNVVSKLKSNSEYSLVIFEFACDYSCPTLYSFDSDGIRLDSINLTPGQCGEDPSMKNSEWFIISESISIELSDTTEHYTDGNQGQILDSTTVETQRYKLNANGKFDFVAKNKKLLE